MTLVGDVIVGKAVHAWGHGVYGKSVYLLFNFSVNLKVH